MIARSRMDVRDRTVPPDVSDTRHETGASQRGASEIDTRGFKTPDKGDAQRLWNLAPLMPAGRNYSRINQGRPELIDHILVSELLVRKVDINSVGAVIAEPLPWITPVPTARLNEPSSDHAPVVATFLM